MFSINYFICLIVTRSRQKLMGILNDNGYNEPTVEIGRNVFFDLCFMKSGKKVVRHQSTHTRYTEVDEIDDINDELSTDNITGNIPTVAQQPQHQQVLKVIKNIPFGAKGRKRRASLFANQSVFNDENQTDNQYNVRRETQKKSKGNDGLLIDLNQPTTATKAIGNNVLPSSLQGAFNDLEGIDFSAQPVHPEKNPVPALLPIKQMPIRPIPIRLNPTHVIPVMMETTDMENRKQSLKTGFVSQMILNRVNQIHNANINGTNNPSTLNFDGIKDSTTSETSDFGQLRYDSDSSDEWD